MNNDRISATLYSDPACPWAYSENPALRVIEWRYGDQLDWRLVLVGLSEDTSRYRTNGYTPARGAVGQLTFRDRYGMPFAGDLKPRMSASSRACRAVIAARLRVARQRVAGVPRAPARQLQQPACVRRRRADARRSCRGVPGVDAT